MFKNHFEVGTDKNCPIHRAMNIKVRRITNARNTKTQAFLQIVK
jgi:hypothetical protein